MDDYISFSSEGSFACKFASCIRTTSVDYGTFRYASTSFGMYDVDSYVEFNHSPGKTNLDQNALSVERVDFAFLVSLQDSKQQSKTYSHSIFHGSAIFGVPVIVVMSQ
jgi:hypothetical protein